jgi:hypothetical protein
LHVGPRLTNPLDQTGEFCHAAGRTVLIGRTKLGTKQMIAAENVKRQVTILLVIALEKAAELIAVDGVVGGVEVENDLLRRRRMGFDKEVGQNLFHVGEVGRDLFVAAVFIGPWRREFQPVERTLAGQRLAAITFSHAILTAGIEFSGQHGHQRIVSQLVVIGEVFVSQSDAVHPLGDQFGDGMFDEFRVAIIGEALGESLDNGRFPFDFPQQQPAGVGGDVPAIEDSNDFPLAEGLKSESIRVTLCLHWVVLLCLT